MSARAEEQRGGSGRPRSPATSRTWPAPRADIAAALALSLAGLVVSAVLARLHAQAHAGATSFCALTDTVNCDRVALSPLSVQIGLPVAVWGMIAYALMAGLASSGVPRRPPGSTWPAGLLLIVSTAAAAASVALAVLSKVAVGAWCPLCVASWLISFGLVAAAWRACRGPGASGAIRADLAVLRERPLRAGAVALLLPASIAFTSAAYPRYWERGAPANRQPGREAASPGAAAMTSGPLLVFGYTDYECPFCARMHEATRALAGRADVTLVRRHFPLDPACNPAVKRQVHPSACALARASICAEAQGRLDEMEDALFANQRARPSVEVLASRLGLDFERFRACLSSPETERRLAADVAAGVRDGVRATPSYVVGGTVHAGRLPPELLRAMGAAHGG
jgi:uncharacterized membrane protein/protein-disulfide isomerase